MMWEYAEAGRLMTYRSAGTNSCIYCSRAMFRLPAAKYEHGNRNLLAQLTICPYCGWWNVYRVHQGEHPLLTGIEGYDGAVGSLREFDLTDVRTPINELRRYLLMHANNLYKVHPRRFEEIVCSVFRDLGYIARATAYTHDGGVDVVLENATGGTVGVQVKRNACNRPIEVEQIRSFAGALLVNGYTKGVFVTTSSFRRGARAITKRLRTIGYPIELVDAARFFEILGIAQLKSFTLDEKRYASWVLSRGVHLGSGVEREFVPGENLEDRAVIARAMLASDFIDLNELAAI